MNLKGRKTGRRCKMNKYKVGPNGYALYFYKGLWKESASVKNEDVERLNKGNNNG